MNKKTKLAEHFDLTHTLMLVCTVAAATLAMVGALAVQDSSAFAEALQSPDKRIDSKVHPVNPMNPSQDADPLEPKISPPQAKEDMDQPENESNSKMVTTTHKLKSKKRKISERQPPIAFLSERTPVATLNPPLELQKTASGDFALHLSGKLLFGTISGQSSILPSQEI